MKLAKYILEEIISPDNSLGIERKDMPQIKFEDMEEFLQHVKDSGRDYEKCSIPAKDLIPSQGELDTDKADKILKDDKAHESPIIVSQDNYVLDGHHRWLAVHRNNSEDEMSCIKLGDNAKPALELMHKFEKTKKVDIEDNVVESVKLAKQVLALTEDSGEWSDTSLEEKLTEHLAEIGFSEISVSDVDANEEAVTVTFISEEDSETELIAIFFNDEELGPVVTVVDDEDDFDKDEVDVIALSEYNPALTINGMIDFSSDLSWLTEELIESILNFDEEDEIDERTVTVIRKGKKVRKKIIRKIRKKRLSAKRKASIKRGVRARRKKKAITARKRKRSLKIRKRAKLKSKPKNLRVVG